SVVSTAFTLGSPVNIDPHANAWAREGDLAGASTDHVDFEFHPLRGKHYSVRAIAADFTPVVDVAMIGSGGQVTEVNFYNYPSDANQTHDPNAREANVAQFSADGQGRYILRVSATTLASGHFSVVVTEVQ